LASQAHSEDDSLGSVTVVGDYRANPSEGMQVITAAIVDGLRERGRVVATISPGVRSVPALFRSRGTVVFTHGPGVGTILASMVLRWASRRKVVWIASRPEYPKRTPRWRLRSAHVVIGNRKHDELENWAADARFIKRFIGLTPDRMAPSTLESGRQSLAGRPLEVIHLGHVRQSRGLPALARAQEELGAKVRTIVYASPTFPADEELVAELREAGVEVRIGAINVLDAYKECDVYVFPVEQAGGGAVELPLTVLEALAAGAPVVSTPYGVLPDALKDVPGVTFYRDDSELIQALRTAATRKAENLPSLVGDFPSELRIDHLIGTLDEVLA
jgi:glycosyltransferase involved in cell wall biosynthesis